jgi:hypothetical protein
MKKSLIKKLAKDRFEYHKKIDPIIEREIERRQSTKTASSSAPLNHAEERGAEFIITEEQLKNICKVITHHGMPEGARDFGDTIRSRPYKPKSANPGMDEALNMGDGVYRP